MRVVVQVKARILAIDPGPERSGYVVLGPGIAGGIASNEEIRESILPLALTQGREIVIERVASYGMAVGASVFETCEWIGRFAQIAEQAGRPPRLMYRRDVKLHLCGSAQAKDTNVWHALRDRYGGQDAVGTKRAPGPLYGIRSHARAALALALTAMEERKGQ